MPQEYTAALRNNDKKQALKVAVNYFRNRPAPQFFADLKERKYDMPTAERAVRGDITVVNIAYQFPDGRIDFMYNPTRHTGTYNPEWQLQLNRMYFWNDMALAYLQSKDEKFASAFNCQAYNWITTIHCPEKYNAHGSAWRTIETGLRLMGSWQTAFEVFRKSPSVADETLALMLASMHEQAFHALEHRTSHNWLLMELNGTHTFAALFPEFKTSITLRRKAAKYFTREIVKQLLPDGMHNELSPDYHSVCLSCGFMLYNIAQQCGTLNDLPEEFALMLEKCYDARLQLMTPGFTQPRTNDCFTIQTAPSMQKAYTLFPHRKDFLWAASKGKSGTPPAGGTASRFLDYAGFIAMRSAWDKDALYLCFDVGPLGEAHVHQDKLNINIYKGSEELLFDDGGGQYEVSPYRVYGRSAAGHNTILVDNDGQNRKVRSSSKTAIDAKFFSSEKFDYAYGIYDDAYGEKQKKPATHTREILFVKPDFFAVADTMQSLDGKPHDYTMLLQIDSVDVKASTASVHGVVAGKYDLYVLLLSSNVSVKVESGQNDPVSGWYVGRNDKNLHKASTVKITAHQKKDFRFLTLFFPLKKGTVPPQAKQLGNKKWAVTFNGTTCQIDLDDLQANCR